MATRIAQTFPNTVKLATFAVVFAVILGLTFGVISAIKQYTALDNIVMSISMIGVSMPSFWCGLLLMLLFCVELNWLPASGYVLRDAPEMEIIHWYRHPRRAERFVELWLPVEKQG